MRVKGRQQGRFVSLSGIYKERGHPEDRYEVKIFDEQGKPISHLMEWFRLRKEPGPDRTRHTYLDLLLPFVGHQLRKGYAWNAEPKHVRAQIGEFLRDGLACIVSPDTEYDGIRWEVSSASPLSESGIRGFLAAAKDFYDTMIEAGYYRFQNPLRSELLLSKRKEWLRTVQNVGAPDIAGIREKTWEETGQHPTAFFRQKNATHWKPALPLMRDTAQQRMGEALLFMIEHAPFQRDQVILLLLRYTGARPHEVLALTAGGYRKDPDSCRAVVVNKRSRGREVKTIHFTDFVRQALLSYIRTERAIYDQAGRKRLEDLDDHDPIFLTEQGKPYNYDAFRYHWRRLYTKASQQYKVTFKLYDIRHLFVTRYIQLAKESASGDAVKLAELKEGLQLLMAWRSPHTMRAYDHSFREAEGFAQLAVMHQDMDQEHSQPVKPRVGSKMQQGSQTEPPTEPKRVPFAIAEDDEDLIIWVQHH